VRSIAAGARRPVRSTPCPSRTISIWRVRSRSGWPAWSGRSATSSRIEFVPQSIAATRLISPGLPTWQGERSQGKQHPGVAERVGLDPLQVEELGHALVVGAQQLLVDLWDDRSPVDRHETE